MKDEFKNMSKLLIRSRDMEGYTVIEFNKPSSTNFSLCTTFSEVNPDEFIARIIGEDIRVLNFGSYEDYEKNYLMKDL